MQSVDLNADLGEGFGIWELGDDDAMLEIVTSANVACGFHAGDPVRLAGTCQSAATCGVRVGAQVGYHDLRRDAIGYPEAQQLAAVRRQITGMVPAALQALARTAGTPVGYVKPHGALYNTIVKDREQARAVAEAVHAVDPALPVLGLSGSVFFDEARRLGLRTVAEAFADRAYRPDGQLVSRREKGAVLHDPNQIAERVATMVASGRVTAADGSTATCTITLKNSVFTLEAARRELAAGRDVLFDIDWQGTQQLSEKARGDVVSVEVQLADGDKKRGSRPGISAQIVLVAAAGIRHPLPAGGHPPSACCARGI